MSVDFYAFQLALIREVFLHTTYCTKLNGVACKRCGQVPSKEDRVDCDEAMEPEDTLLVTFHKECWLKYFK